MSKDGLVQKEMLVQCHYDECSSSASGDQKKFLKKFLYNIQGLGYTIIIIPNYYYDEEERIIKK